MQPTWRTSQCLAGAAFGHGADKLQTAALNAGLGSRRAQSPFSPSYLSTKYPQVTSHGLDLVSRSERTKARTVYPSKYKDQRSLRRKCRKCRLWGDHGQGDMEGRRVRGSDVLMRMRSLLTDVVPAIGGRQGPGRGVLVYLARWCATARNC